MKIHKCQCIETFKSSERAKSYKKEQLEYIQG